jgi:2-succinyl-5-enolpyruvyl-6-hydroxy-3-cyclohexene-1-carboxylate synthase
VVVIGRPTLHRSVSRLLDDGDVAVYAVPAADAAPWTGAPGTVRAAGRLPTLCPPGEFTARWQAADAAAATTLDSRLDGAPHTAPVGLRLARDLVAALPAGALLVLGSSNPVRDASLAAVPRAGLTVLSNRGVSGIDGTVSTSVGAALAHGGPAYALLGDLTLLHDTTGLVIGPDEPRPQLTLVVLNDGGGGVFSLLEQGAPEHSAAFERVFGTPHGVDLAALSAAVGVPHLRLDELDMLAKAVEPEPGIRLVEVPATRSTLRAGHAAVRKAINEAVDAATGDAG